MVRLIVSRTGSDSLAMEATKARTKTKRRPTRDDSEVRTESQQQSRRDGDPTAHLSESTTKVATSRPQNSQEKEESVSSRPKNTASSEKSPAKTKQKSNSKSLMPAQPSESNTTVDASNPQSSQDEEGIIWSKLEKATVQPAQSKPLKVYRRYVPTIREPQEVNSKRPQTSMKFFKKISSSKSQVSRSDEETTTRRSGAGDHATKLEEKRITDIGTRPPHSTGREVIVPTVGGIEARNDESSERDTGEKHIRQNEKKDSADTLRQPGPNPSSNSKSKSASTRLFQGFAGKAGLLASPAQYSKHNSKVTKKRGVSNPLALAPIAPVDESVEVFSPSDHTQRVAGPVNRKPSSAPSRSRSIPRPSSTRISRPSLSNALALLSMESMDESVEAFLPFGIPRPRPTLLSQARIKRKPAVAPSTRPKPANEKPPQHPVLSKDGVKASHQSKIMQGPTQGVGKKKSAPKASPQPQAGYQNPVKSSATNAQRPSFSKDAHSATSIEASHRTKDAATLEKNSQSLLKMESSPVTSTQPKPVPQNPPDEETQCRVYSETADTFKTGTISDPGTALRQAATEATVRDRLNLTRSSVGEGEICHVRVTLGNLSGVFTSRDPSSSNSSPKDRDNSLVVGYAEMVTHASKVDTSVKSADSIPITPQMGDGGKSPFRIVWSSRKKGDPKTRNRLYFSVALEKQGGKFEHSLIRVGVRRGEQKIPLGLVPLQVGGNALERQKFDLELQPIEPRRRKGFFWDGELDTSKHSFRDDDLIYGISDIGLLRVRIDVKKGIYENSGPVLWCDVIRDDELDVRSPGSFFDASLRGSHLTMKDDTYKISYVSKAPSNADDEQSRVLQEVSESEERSAEKKNRPLSNMEKVVPLPFVEKVPCTLGVEKRSEVVVEERDDIECFHIPVSQNEGREKRSEVAVEERGDIECFHILGSQNEGRDSVSKSELRSSIVAREDETGQSLLVETPSHSGVPADKQGSIQLGESGSSPVTKSSVIDVRHESEVESLVESIAIPVGIGFSPSDLGGETIKAAGKRDVENTRGPLSPLVKDESDEVTTASEEGVKTNSAWILEMFLCRKLDRPFTDSQTLTTFGEEESALNDWTPMEVPEVATTERVENNEDQGSLLVRGKLDDAATIPEGGVENINGVENTNDVKDKSDESTFEAVPSGDDNSTYAAVAEDDSESTQSSDDSSNASAVEQQSGFETALLRLQDSFLLPEVIDHAASIIYGEAVRVGIYSYGSSDSSEVSNASSLNDGIRLQSYDSSRNKDDISIGLPPSHSNEK
jgi:hypothetical protein